ncbi:MAG: iron complex outermembrane receptor protein [Cognaticolwellia sp.]|jgi:iron complex outermembrane receptor protein
MSTLRTPWKAAGWLTLLALVLVSPAAHADPKDEARRAFNSGLELIEAGDYEGGIASFEQAYALVPHPVVLYNIGRAYADAGDYEQATVYFERYLQTEPIDRSEVEANIRLMQSRLAEAEPSTPNTPSVARAGGGSATADEIAQLQRYAEELSALADTLAQREAAAEIAPVGTVPAATGPTLSTDGAGLEGGLVEDLYARKVVTASRFGQDPLEAPAAVTLIEREDIQASGATTIPELLATVPGMDVMQLTAGQADVSARGFNRRLSNKLLVLVDGRTVYLDSVGTTLWASLPVTMDEIERIEVIRGPGSAIYGADAFAGVVNIITQTPGEPGAKNVARFTVGTKGTTQGATVITGRSGDVGYRASAGYTTLGRWGKEIDLDNDPYWTSTLANQDRSMEALTANGQLDWRIGDEGFASVSGGVSDGLVELYSLGALRNFYFDQRLSYARADAGYGPFYARVFVNRQGGVVGNWYEPAGTTAPLNANLDSTIADATLTGDFSFGEAEQHKLLVGVNYRYKQIDWDFLGQSPVEHHLGGYAQLQSRFDPVLVNAAVRVDRHPLLQRPVASPRLAVITSLGQGRALRVNGGTAFRTPTYMESYADLYLSTGTDGIQARTIGDQNLRPERITAFEVGYMDESSDVFRAEANLFVYQVDDLIDLGPVDTTGYPQSGFDPDAGVYIAGESSFVNEATTYRAAGGEVSADYFGLPGLDLTGSYALEFINQNLDGETTPVRSNPRHKLNGQVVYRSPFKVDATLGAQFVDRQVWGIRSFDETGQVVITNADLPSRVVGTARLAWSPAPPLTMSLNAWNWTADFTGPTKQHPLGQPVGSRYTASLAYRF